MSKDNDQSKIAITKNGKDLFRLIFVPAGEGKYDVKICCLGKPYIVDIYQHFAYRPIRIDPIQSQEKEITYHHGQGKWPVLIHLKNTQTEESHQQYETVLSLGLNAPSTQAMFPQPLFKIEIPQSLVDFSSQYHPKKETAQIEIENNNVIEFYLTRPSFKSEDFYNRFYPLYSVYSTLSIEYFCTNSLCSGLEKEDALKTTHEKERTVGIAASRKDVSVQTAFYYHRNADADKKCRITLFQNDLAEDILLNTPVISTQEGLVFSPLLKIAMSSRPDHLQPQTATALTIAQGRLTAPEKESLYRRAILGKTRLYREITNCRQRLEQEKQALEKEARLFMNALFSLRNEILEKGRDGKPHSIRDDDAWIISSYPFNSLEISLLFLCHKRKDSCYLITRKIIGPRYKEEIEGSEEENNSNGKPTLRIGPVDLETVIWDHTILGFDDFWDIDLLRGFYNNYFDPTAPFVEPEIKVSRGYLPNDSYEQDPVYQKLRVAGYFLQPFVFQWVTKNDLKKMFEGDAFRLKRVLGKIELRMLQISRAENERTHRSK
jgi:hypothetical protein